MAAKGTIAGRIRSWCAYQERSQHETRKKLHSMGVGGDDAENIIAGLIAENFLNEERFATALAGGKFRIRHWGRNRIRQELQWHQVSEPCIRLALESIGDEDYQRALRMLAGKRLDTILNPDRRKKFYTVSRYLVSKGFESELVTGTLNQLLGEVSDYEFRT